MQSATQPWSTAGVNSVNKIAAMTSIASTTYEYEASEPAEGFKR